MPVTDAFFSILKFSGRNFGPYKGINRAVSAPDSPPAGYEENPETAFFREKPVTDAFFPILKFFRDEI